MTTFDIGTVIGGAWCVTAVRGRDPEHVLAAMGVEPGSVRARSADEETFADGRGFVFAHRLPAEPAWTLTLEMNGGNGFLGWRPEILAPLSAGGGVACALTNTDDLHVDHAEDGVLLLGMELPAAYARWGADPDRFLDRLAEFGFPVRDDQRPSGRAAETQGTQEMTLLLTALTGVELDDAAFADPWTGGTVRF